MRATISSGIGSLLSVMASHVRRSIQCGADAPRHFVRPLPGRRSATIRSVGGPPDRVPIGLQYLSIFDRAPGPPAPTDPALGLARQTRSRQAPPSICVAPPPATASLQGHLQILVKSGIADHTVGL